MVDGGGAFCEAGAAKSCGCDHDRYGAGCGLRFEACMWEVQGCLGVGYCCDVCLGFRVIISTSWNRYGLFGTTKNPLTMSYTINCKSLIMILINQL